MRIHTCKYICKQAAGQVMASAGVTQHLTHRDLFPAHLESNFGPPDSVGVKLRPSTAHRSSPGPMLSQSHSFRGNPRPRRPARLISGQTSTRRDLFPAHFERNFDSPDTFGVAHRHTLTHCDVACSMKRQSGHLIFCSDSYLTLVGYGPRRRHRRSEK